MPTAASRLMPNLRRVVLAGAGVDRTDGQLLGAFVTDRDADAFAGLVRRHGPMVLGVCRRVTGDHTSADDAFQAVFIVLARRASAVKPREQVGNWLYGVAYRTALKARAVLARRRSREKQVDVMPEPPVSHRTSTDWADLQPLIDEELARLPDKLRLPVVLCDLEGRAQRDVAKHLGIPAATLATRLSTARRTLSTRLTKRGVTLSGGALAGLLSAHGTASAVPHALVRGVARAAEAVAGGNVVSTLVSAQAVQLSEGVMRMMLLSKLKTVAVTALTIAALTGGLGLGLVPAYAIGAGNEPGQVEKPAVKPTEPPADPARVAEVIDELIGLEAKWEADVKVTDPEFLRRVTLDLRGTLPTDVEMFFFVGDEDENKRGKVVVWLVDDGDVKTFVAKKLGVPADRVRVIRALDAGTGKLGGIVLVVEMGANKEPQALAFSPDGRRLAIEYHPEVKNPTTFFAPLVVDLDARLNLNTIKGAEQLLYSADKDALWADATGSLLTVQADEKQLDSFWARLQPRPKTARLRAVDATEGKSNARETVYWPADGMSNTLWVEGGVELYSYLEVGESDVDFLKRVIKDVRGGAPTALEEKYFAEDKDAKKREKLLDALLKDPAVAKKVGDDWKKNMLATPQAIKGTARYNHLVLPTTGAGEGTLRWSTPNTANQYKLVYPNVTNEMLEGKLVFPAPYVVDPKLAKQPPVPKTPAVPKPPAPVATPKPPVIVKPPVPPVPPQPPVEKIDKIVAELIAAKKSDAEILDGITLVLLGRLPSEAEKKLALGLVAKAADRKAAWLEVARALASTSEGKERSDALELKDRVKLWSVIDGTSNTLELKVTPGLWSTELYVPVEVKPVPPPKK